MHLTLSPHTPIAKRRFVGFIVPRWALALLAVALLWFAPLAHAEEIPTATNTEIAPSMLPAIELAPFVIKGEPLSISILARSKSDRRYGERFTEEVIEVVHETLEGSTGKGLIIIGKKGEPHPIFIFWKFIAMAEANQLDPKVAALAPALKEILSELEKEVRIVDNSKDALNITFDMFVKALPMPLKGTASRLYQLAWNEGFELKRVELMLASLTEADFTTDELSKFDWVFYLPPKKAFNQVLKEVLPVAMKQKKIGFFKRAAMRSALFVFKPVIKKAIEGMRKGLLFRTVLHAQSNYSKDDITALSEAYIKVLMPDFKFNRSKTQQRAIEAVNAQKIKNIEYAKDPYVAPEPLYEVDYESYAAFEGKYGNDPKDTTNRFKLTDETFTWQYRKNKPLVFLAAGERLFVQDNGNLTLEFLVDDEGTVTGVEVRWKRHRKTILRQP